MAKKDYYLILGVSRRESHEGIRAAYRQLAKKHHPDCAGSEQTRVFQEIAEAYCVLSDPAARESYDRSLGGRCGGSGAGSEPVEVKRGAPFGAKARRGGFSAAAERRSPFEAAFDRSWSPLDDIDNIFDSFFDTFGGFGFGTEEKRGREPLESHRVLNVEVTLTPDEAGTGGDLPLTVPIARECPYCTERPRFRRLSCPRCRGRGVVEEERRVRLRIPPMVRDGFDIRVHFEGGHGVQSVTLAVRIRVSEG